VRAHDGKSGNKRIRVLFLLESSDMSSAYKYFLAFCLGSATLVGQQPKVDLKAEEAVIRALASGRKDGVPPRTNDQVYWSPDMKRPIVRPEAAQLFAPPSKRKNVVSVIKVQRLELAASGDMAWEYSYQDSEWDTDGTPSRHEHLHAAFLRVWKKINGEWKSEAFFERPLDVPFAEK
jgi:hypothetical protein